MNKRVNYIYKYGLYEYGLSLVDFSLIIYESKSELLSIVELPWPLVKL